ncbi:MAG: glutamyl-tRNA reductase [Chlamydiae bacterium CG10_big_fil_rev_8_21_14_0_10_42_34]|nr:MAG: glutamyl-tRNA reductase [Chlamydiae bacterium CG10_big_fil_rev_8_21_14_0_10_42_34]
MLSIGVLGINFKTADLALREAIARGAQTLNGERAIFFSHPIVVLSTCNRTEIYFSDDDLPGVHSDLLAYLRKQIEVPFEHRLYSYFGTDCFTHLCRVTAGLDSAIFAETEIQRQVKLAYGKARVLPSCLHFAFQKALKVGKTVRTQLELERGSPTLYSKLWQMTNWKNKRILIVGHSEINRGLISFLQHKDVQNISICTRYLDAVKLEGIHLSDRNALNEWQQFDVIVCASRSEKYLIKGQGSMRHWIFDLSVPRNVDPEVGKSTNLYNIDELIERNEPLHKIEACEALVRSNVTKLARIYRVKTQHGLENVEMQSHL